MKLLSGWPSGVFKHTLLSILESLYYLTLLVVTLFASSSLTICHVYLMGGGHTIKLLVHCIYNFSQRVTLTA